MDEDIMRKAHRSTTRVDATRFIVDRSGRRPRKTRCRLRMPGRQYPPDSLQRWPDMVKFQPDGWHTVTPRIVVPDPHNLIEFVRAVFHAQGAFRPGLPAEIRIGDSVVMISGEDGLRDPMPAFLYVYVEDADRVYQRALAAHAISLEAPADLPYGDRRAMVQDPWGNRWQIATHQRDLPVDEIRARLAGGG
ncbi:VOC family protein [Burkholderia metallica]|uniref:VOC family protein n=1 Tax=Burkholderia metallica TaxID=488729 RepID=UPI001CF1B1DF|nr:VOC family protein [Burkholderia metallica]MCA8000306.1 VOC family protein [Burkholderia metallica]